jgi:hypothetical protein
MDLFAVDFSFNELQFLRQSLDLVSIKGTDAKFLASLQIKIEAELVEKIKQYVPLEIIQAEYTKDPDGRNYIVSSEKLYNTGFNCTYDLDFGIKELIKVVNMIDEPINANY